MKAFFKRNDCWPINDNGAKKDNERNKIAKHGK
jgi:hypothetical protein